jgi:hypothetical protein
MLRRPKLPMTIILVVLGIRKTSGNQPDRQQEDTKYKELSDKIAQAMILLENNTEKWNRQIDELAKKRQSRRNSRASSPFLLLHLPIILLPLHQVLRLNHLNAHIAMSIPPLLLLLMNQMRLSKNYVTNKNGF